MLAGPTQIIVKLQQKESKWKDLGGNNGVKWVITANKTTVQWKKQAEQNKNHEV